MSDQAVRNWNQVNALRSALAEGTHGLGTVPDLVVQVWADGSWRDFVTPRGEHVRHERFIDFVTGPPLAGLGSDEKQLRGVCVDSAMARNVLDEALQGQQGHRTDLGNNVPEVSRPEGNSEAKALRRLRKDAPELHARVLAGELKAHAAMVKAGFRHKTITIPVDRPESAAKTLRAHMAADSLAELVSLLSRVSRVEATKLGEPNA